jgi:hypothetical protein
MRTFYGRSPRQRREKRSDLGETAFRQRSDRRRHRGSCISVIRDRTPTGRSPAGVCGRCAALRGHSLRAIGAGSGRPNRARREPSASPRICAARRPQNGPTSTPNAGVLLGFSLFLADFCLFNLRRHVIVKHHVCVWFAGRCTGIVGPVPLGSRETHSTHGRARSVWAVTPLIRVAPKSHSRNRSGNNVFVSRQHIGGPPMRKHLHRRTIKWRRIAQLAPVAVEGVGASNDDGSERQQILRKCQAGMRVVLRREGNHSSAMALYLPGPGGQQIGYLAQDVSAWVAPLLDSGRAAIDAEIWSRDRSTADDGSPLVGCTIMLTQFGLVVVERFSWALALVAAVRLPARSLKWLVRRVAPLMQSRSAKPH